MNEIEFPTLSIETQKGAKRHAWIATIIYMILSPIFVILAFFGYGIASPFSHFGERSIFSILNLLVFLCIPSSIPITLYLVWFRYFQCNYRKTCEYCFIPIQVLIFTFFASIILFVIKSMF